MGLDPLRTVQMQFSGLMWMRKAYEYEIVNQLENFKGFIKKLLSRFNNRSIVITCMLGIVRIQLIGMVVKIVFVALSSVLWRHFVSFRGKNKVVLKLLSLAFWTLQFCNKKTYPPKVNCQCYISTLYFRNPKKIDRLSRLAMAFWTLQFCNKKTYPPKVNCQCYISTLYFRNPKKNRSLKSIGNGI
jgi:hypothetical protein